MGYTSLAFSNVLLASRPWSKHLIKIPELNLIISALFSYACILAFIPVVVCVLNF